MVKDLKKLESFLVNQARLYAGTCKKVFVATSGGVDSSLVVAILCEAFTPENVIGLHRLVRSNPVHLKDAQLLQKKFGFNLVIIDANDIYSEIISRIKSEFVRLGLPWADEGTLDAEKLGFTNAYASLKSRLTTPLSGFISKAIDGGNGRIFGTGNGEEDGILRYFDKFGDGAVDNNILNGLTKAEVRQLATSMGVPEEIVTKKPSADLQSNGDLHNDEEQLSGWARELGYPISISYGAPDGSSEGNIAWAWKEDLKHGVITGSIKAETKFENYTPEQISTIFFLRKIEEKTRHKVDSIPGAPRSILSNAGLVD